MSDAKRNTEITLRNVRLSYAHIYEPYQPRDYKEGDKLKYTTVVLLPKSEVAQLKGLKKALANAGLEKWTAEKLKAKRPDPYAIVRDGDIEWDERGEAYKDHWFFSASSVRSIKVVKKRSGKVVNTEENEVVSGDYVDIILGAYPYQVPTSMGVALGLRAVCLIEKGEPLGGGSVNVEKGFADSADLEDDDQEWGDDDDDDDNPLA